MSCHHCLAEPSTIASTRIRKNTATAEHFRVLVQARAIENQSYVIASNRVGKDDDLWFCGSSAIIDPRGVVVAAASADREELIQADVSQELVASVRQRIQSLGHRRQDLYS
jgi:predicted amidohydrolase